MTSLLVAACALVGCAGDSDGDQAKAPARSAKNADAPPRLLTLKEVKSEGSHPAEEAVLKLWYWGQWGSAPSLAASYAPQVREGVGVDNLVGAYAQQRDPMMRSRPSVVQRFTTPIGTFVGVKVERENEAATSESYLLQGRGRDWVIVHDTFFERALASFVQSTVQTRVNPRAKEVSRRAAIAGQEAARNFRGLFARAQPGG